MTHSYLNTAARPTYNKAQTKLIQATLDSLMDEGIDGCSVRKICERAGSAVGLINYYFGTLNDLLAATYLDLASSNQAFRVFLEQSFAELNNMHPVSPSPRLAAIGLTAIIDGLWLEWCLSSETFSADEAILLCEQWVDGACK